MSPHVSRRALFTGAGGLTGALALGTAGAPAAAARPSGPSAVSGGGHARPAAPPSGTPASIASAPQPGVSYEFRGWADFLPPDDLSDGRTFGGNGAYTSSGSAFLAAFVDIAPGAIIHDVEFYLSNASDVVLYGEAWVPGTGAFYPTTWLEQTHPANSSMHAVKYVIGSAVNGPFPFGTRLCATLPTPDDGTVQIDGVRFGLIRAPLSTVLLPTPVRVYDSTTATPISAGQTRTVSLAAQLPVGANGALLALSAVRTTGAGVLNLAPVGGTALPGVRWARTGDVATNTTTTSVPGTRTVALSVTGTGAKTDCYVDLIGYLI